MKKASKMSKEYTNIIRTNEDIEHDWVTLLQRKDGSYAVPGGGYIVKRGDAEKAAKNLARSNSRMKKKLNALVDKTVNRLNGASSETSIMSA